MTDRFTYVKRGYDPEEADLYIETLERELKGYKEKDNSIRNAILNAQIAADSIILNAKNESRAIRENALMHVREIQASVSTQRAMLNEFHREYTQLLDKYLHRVRSDDFDIVLQKINELEAFFDRFATPEAQAAKEGARPTPQQQGQARPAARRPAGEEMGRRGGADKEQAHRPAEPGAQQRGQQQQRGPQQASGQHPQGQPPIDGNPQRRGGTPADMQQRRQPEPAVAHATVSSDLLKDSK